MVHDVEVRSDLLIRNFFYLIFFFSIQLLLSCFVVFVVNSMLYVASFISLMVILIFCIEHFIRVTGFRESDLKGRFVIV